MSSNVLALPGLEEVAIKEEVESPDQNLQVSRVDATKIPSTNPMARKRGRPLKNLIRTNHDSPLSEGHLPETVKRGRGRPPKIRIDGAESSSPLPSRETTQSKGVGSSENGIGEALSVSPVSYAHPISGLAQLSGNKRKSLSTAPGEVSIGTERKRGRPWKTRVSTDVSSAPISFRGPTEPLASPPGFQARKEPATSELPSMEPVQRKMCSSCKNNTDKAVPLELFPMSSTPGATSLASSQEPSRESHRRKQQSSSHATLACDGKVAGYQSQTCLQGMSAEAPLDSRADHTKISTTSLQQSNPLVVAADARDAHRTSPPNLQNAIPATIQVQTTDLEESLPLGVTTEARVVQDPSPSQIQDPKENTTADQSSNGPVDAIVPPEYHALYRKIVARHGSLIGDIPGYLLQTYTALTEELLKTISLMMRTEHKELCSNDISKWEKVIKFAADGGFNVSWLAEILGKMREYVSGDFVTEEVVNQKAAMVDNLKGEHTSSCEQLKEVFQRVKSVEIQLAAAKSELEVLKERLMSADFFGDLR